MTPAPSSLHFTVRVDDRRNAALTGRDGSTYVSPPHEYEHAIELARVLLDTERLVGDGPWRRPVAGGERVVSLEAADTLFDPAG